MRIGKVKVCCLLNWNDHRCIDSKAQYTSTTESKRKVKGF